MDAFQKGNAIFATGKNNAMGVEEMLISRGLEKGLKQGREEERKKLQEEKKKLYYTFVKNHLQHTKFSIPKIASLLGVSEAYVREIKRELKK